MENKKCSKCKEIKPISKFYKQPHGKYDVMGQCKECKKRYRKEYAKDHIDKIKIYRLNHIKETREYHKEYRKKYPNKVKIWRNNNPEKVKKYWKKQNKMVSLNPMLRLRNTMRASIIQSLKTDKNGNCWESLTGYNLQDLIIHLEKQFKNGMNWSNQGKWHIDHIIPISLWKFNSSTDREFKQCWALCNLQPLWAKENLKKHNNI